MAIINEPSGGWAQYSKIYEFYVPASGDNSMVEFDLEFGYSLLPTETFQSATLEISPDALPYGVNISGLRAYGHYDSYFEANGVSLPLTYRDRTTLEISTVDGFSALPSDATTCDVIEFVPPGELEQNFIYTVTLNYIDITDPLLPIEKTITQTYTQTLYGSYQSYGNRLIDYINRSGPFPRI